MYWKIQQVLRTTQPVCAHLFILLLLLLLLLGHLRHLYDFLLFLLQEQRRRGFGNVLQEVQRQQVSLVQSERQEHLESQSNRTFSLINRSHRVLLPLLQLVNMTVVMASAAVPLPALHSFNSFFSCVLHGVRVGEVLIR